MLKPIEVPDDISREDAIRMARILAKALHHARRENSELHREYVELIGLMLDRAKQQREQN